MGGNNMGILYVCPTPIGNLEDITMRVLRILGEVDLIAAEDTRHTRKLLNHFEISTKAISYHEHNKEKSGPKIIEDLKNGLNVALVSDAGMPGISDPGEDLVKLCIEHGIEFYVLPGASAVINALVGSGLNTRKFAFEGFLDRSNKKRRERLELIKNEDRTLVFYEAPHRLKETLKDMYKVLGDRHISVCRELTKKYEEFIRGSISEVLEIFSTKEVRGEFVVLVEGLDEKIIESGEDLSHLTLKEYVEKLMGQGLSKKDAIKKVAKLRGLQKNDVYSQCLDIEI